MHLAELNIADWKIPADDPRAAFFHDNLDRINALAARSEGFVWRYTDDGASPEELSLYDQSKTAINMSVWETAEHLENFVWNTVHKKIYERKNEWFEVMGSHHFVMWWVEEGYQPSLHEAKERLAYLDQHGNSDHAFDWSHLPHVKLWQTQRCA